MTNSPPADPQPAPAHPLLPPTRNTLVVGLLGGIGSGKSSVARALAGAKGLCIDADRLAHEALDEPNLRRWLAERLGPGVLGPDGRIARAALATHVFGDSRLRAELERWIHPAVRAKIQSALAGARSAGVPIVALDVPLLLENDQQHQLRGECDALVFVDAPLALREQRVQSLRAWAPGELARREALQLPLDDKRACADFSLANTESPLALELALEQLRPRLEALRGSAAARRARC